MAGKKAADRLELLAAGGQQWFWLRRGYGSRGLGGRLRFAIARRTRFLGLLRRVQGFLDRRDHLSERFLASLESIDPLAGRELVLQRAVGFDRREPQRDDGFTEARAKGKLLLDLAGIVGIL